MLTPDGYVYLHIPDHPLANSKGDVLEHRMVVSEHIGRLLLSTELVHHINGNSRDNRAENLAIVSPSEHAKLHHPRLQKERTCGVCRASNLHLIRGLCNNCYQRAWRYDQARKNGRAGKFRIRQSQRGRLCACGRMARTCGVCHKCYKRDLQHQHELSGRVCACGRPVEALGLCKACYMRERQRKVAAGLLPERTSVRCSCCEKYLPHRGLDMCGTCYPRLRQRHINSASTHDPATCPWCIRDLKRQRELATTEATS